LVFYVLLAVMATSGMIMAFDHAAIFKTIIRPVREIHSVGQYLIYTYVLAHLLGVIRADIGKHRGMVSSMIHGAA
ncbi:MAG: cytochrome b/b6 domain-containing protein, partial [Bacteroidota bacterium]|nr:cytochrome b/b6 domain-containing protein [Bacteroidota bacterium]